MNKNHFLIKKDLTNKEKIFNIVGLGEILWDIFPEGKKLGGATILDSIEDLDLDSTYIQSDHYYPTGTVDVKLDGTGQPSYIINKNVAWDFLVLNSYIINKNVAWDFLVLNNSLKELAANADSVCFGTLAQRSLKSEDTISKFLKLTGKSTIKIFDINLRQNFYSDRIIRKLLKNTTILKINSHELKILKDLLGHSNEDSEINLCKKIIHEYNLELLCLTKGDRGSLIINKSNHFIHEGYKVEIADTVGAGDAFTAAMIVQYLKGKTLKEISNTANKLGSWVSSKNGATPVLNEKILKNIL